MALGIKSVGMADSVKSLQALFDKIYNDRIVKQSTKRKKLKLDKQRLRQLMKQRHSQASKKYWLFQEIKAGKSPLSDETGSKLDDKKKGTSEHKICNFMRQERNEVQGDSNDKGRRDLVLETITGKPLKLTKEIHRVKSHTRTDGSFQSGNEKKANCIKGHSVVGKSTQHDQLCNERKFWIDQHRVVHASQNQVLQKDQREKSQRPWAQQDAKTHKPFSSLFSKFHAGPVRQSIVDEF